MKITIHFEPAINDLLLVMDLTEKLTRLAAHVDPNAAQRLRREMLGRLKRLRKVKPSD